MFKLTTSISVSPYSNDGGSITCYAPMHFRRFVHLILVICMHASRGCQIYEAVSNTSYSLSRGENFATQVSASWSHRPASRYMVQTISFTWRILIVLLAAFFIAFWEWITMPESHGITGSIHFGNFLAVRCYSSIGTYALMTLAWCDRLRRRSLFLFRARSTLTPAKVCRSAIVYRHGYFNLSCL